MEIPYKDIGSMHIYYNSSDMRSTCNIHIMERSIKLTVPQLKILLSDLFNQKAGKAIDAVLHMLSDVQIELLMHIMSTPDYILLNKNQKIKFKPDKYQFDTVNVDVLQDLGYVDKHGYHYGRITNDTSYGSDFNPTYYKMNVDCVALRDNKPVSTNIEVYTKDIVAITLDEWKGLE